ARAGVLDRAAVVRRLLRRRVGDVVALAVTTALERVVQADPVADLVRRGVAEVVGRSRTAGEGRREDDDAVHQRLARVVGGERGPAEQPAAHVVDAHVQVFGGALV